MDQSNSTPTGAVIRAGTASPTRNIVETVSSEDRFMTFAGAIRAAGLSDAWAQKGPFTLFAPTEDAFRKLPQGAYEALIKDVGRLKAILNHHVVSGYLMARDVKAGETLTLQGSPLTVALASGEVRINEARVTQVDITATNGIVHAIDTLLLPRGWQLVAAAA